MGNCYLEIDVGFPSAVVMTNVLVSRATGRMPGYSPSSAVALVQFINTSTQRQILRLHVVGSFKSGVPGGRRGCNEGNSARWTNYKVYGNTSEKISQPTTLSPHQPQNPRRVTLPTV